MVHALPVAGGCVKSKSKLQVNDILWHLLALNDLILS